MIKDALTFIRTNLDQYLKLKFGLTESTVVLSRLVKQDGSVPPITQNKVVISLLNLEQENNRQFNTGYTRDREQQVQVSPSQRYNLAVMFVANFDDYEESLKFLDATVGFFQANPSLDSSNTSNTPKGIEKLDMDIEKLDYNQMSNLWSTLGAKYVPSVIYRVRMITIQSDEIVNMVPTVQDVKSNS